MFFQLPAISQLHMSSGALLETGVLCPIKNFDHVTPSIWRGAQPNKEGVLWLAEQGCKTIVDLRLRANKAEQRSAEELSMKYVSLPTAYINPSSVFIDTFLETICSETNSPVFVHCRHGRDRTGMMIGIYRRLVEKHTFDGAYKDMLAHGFRTFFVSMSAAVKQVQP